MISYFKFGDTIIKSRDIVLITSLENRITIYTENRYVYVDFESHSDVVLALKSINNAMKYCTILTEDGDIINIAYISIATMREFNGYVFLDLCYNEKVDNQSIINHIRLASIDNLTKEVQSEILDSIGEISYESFIALYQ